MMLAAVVSGGEAIAQTPSGQQIPQRQDPDNRTPAQREAENYDARGVKVGAFMLFPVMELNELYDDNIYATSSGQTGSFIQVVKPSVELRSLWSQHMLNFYARGALGFYSADASQNYQDVSVGSDGRFDITRTSNVYGSASFAHLHEALGTPNTPVGASTLSQYNQTTASLGYFQEFGRIKAQVDGRLDDYAYNNDGAGPAQGVIPNTDRDRTEFRQSLRVGYEFLPGYQIWTKGDLNQRVYKNTPDSQGYYRNSSGWDVVGGMAFQISSITSFEVFAGYLQQNYVDPRFATISTPTFGLTGYWSPTRELLVKPYVRRTVDDTAISTASGYLSTSGGVDLNYKFRPNIRLDGHADYSIADYQTVPGAAGRYDQYYTFRGGIMYLPTENFFVGPTYQYVSRTSNQVGLGYTDNQILLRLGVRL